MSQSVQSERREFRMHKDILWSIIKSQAGTLAKAILELIMNSIDANATQVSITLNRTGVSVTDDGKGFVSRAEIEQFFETFGTPHKKDDAVFGKFRMGRGQIMAFTRNTWTSGEFQMKVDIRDMGLAYDLHTVHEPFQGCRIDGQLYDTLSPSDVIGVTDSLRSLCKYAQIPVIINGERVSQDTSAVKWTFEDEDAFFLLRQNTRYLEVYNLGVHVKSHYSGDFALGESWSVNLSFR